ncbi:hypothetical protein BD414DRAFT_537311 [Trametes punicea]|nr:hypothetical protein BD414DRAFT_537311 [Trametes punicea]
MHLFRAVFIIAAAIFVFVATEAPHASAFILPLTRYMLDAVPEGSEDSGGNPAVGPAGEIVANPPKGGSSPEADVPVAVETSAVDGNAGGTPASSADRAVTSNNPKSSKIADASTQSLPTLSVEPSTVPSDAVLAKANAAERLAGGSSIVVIGSVLGTMLFML